jgi:excisionase family DNA binding protein
MTTKKRLTDDDPYLPADLERVTALSRDVVRAAILTGELPGYKIGAQYRIPAQAFRDFCAGTWVPRPRKQFAEPLHALPEPADLIKRVG